MCGIIYGKRRDGKAVAKSVLKRYRDQKLRGSQGFGYIAIENGKIKSFLRFENEPEMEKALKAETATEIIFHHRYPTSTANLAELNHPIFVSNKELKHNYYLVHNGVLSNEDTLKERHEKLGYKYNTIVYEKISTETAKREVVTDIEEKFNDSESLAIEVARFLDGKSDKIDTVGTVAFICLQTDKKNNVKALYFARNTGNPLRSEGDTTGDIFFLRSEGGHEDIPANMLFRIDYKTGEVNYDNVNVGVTYKYQTPSHAGYNTHATTDTEDDYYGGYVDGHDLPKAKKTELYDDEDGFPSSWWKPRPRRKSDDETANAEIAYGEWSDLDKKLTGLDTKLQELEIEKSAILESSRAEIYNGIKTSAEVTASLSEINKEIEKLTNEMCDLEDQKTEIESVYGVPEE